MEPRADPLPPTHPLLHLPAAQLEKNLAAEGKTPADHMATLRALALKKVGSAGRLRARARAGGWGSLLLCSPALTAPSPQLLAPARAAAQEGAGGQGRDAGRPRGGDVRRGEHALHVGGALGAARSWGWGEPAGLQRCGDESLPFCYPALTPSTTPICTPLAPTCPTARQRAGGAGPHRGRRRGRRARGGERALHAVVALGADARVGVGGA